MLKTIGLIAVMAAAGALPAMAQTACTAPATPPAIDASKANVDQVRGALTAAQSFMTASDGYQDCLSKDFAAQKAAATKDKPLDPGVEKDMNARVDANQAAKQQVAAAANNLITDFKKVHSCAGQPLASCK
jgi:hypothetical protein